MNISESCTCGANISFDEPSTNVIHESVRSALADFRVGHRCSNSRYMDEAVAMKSTSTTPAF